MSFSDKLMGKVIENKNVIYNCDTCSKCKNNYFINLNINNENKYICSYLCSKDLHLKYGKNYWDYLVNKEDFNKYPTPPIYSKKQEYFKLDISPYDIDRIDYYNEMVEEDKRVSELENCSDSSLSDYESE